MPTTKPPDLQSEAMAAWQRVEHELSIRGENLAWLARELGVKQPQRVYNWKYRGLPVNSYKMVAQVLGKSLDWISGATDHPDPREPRLQQLTSMAKKLAEQLDSIENQDLKLAVFTQCIGVIALAAGRPARSDDSAEDK